MENYRTETSIEALPFAPELEQLVQKAERACQEGDPERLDALLQTLLGSVPELLGVTPAPAEETERRLLTAIFGQA